MSRYVAGRLAWLFLLLLAVSFLTFVIFYLLPAADPALLRAGKDPTPALIAHIRHADWLDRPWYAQYLHYLDRLALHLDLGYSYQNGVPVRSALLERLPASISLALGGALIWLTAGIALGTLAAVRRGQWPDRLAMAWALVAISAPVYWIALVVMLLFAGTIGIVHILPPPGSYRPLSEDPLAWLRSMLAPWLVLAAPLAGIYARLLRASLGESLTEEFVLSARAKGISERRVLARHALPVALGPLVSAAGMDLGLLLGGALLVESAFNIPGIGRLAWESVLSGDLPMIQGTVIVGAFFIICANLLVDLLYAVIDPRVRYR